MARVNTTITWSADDKITLKTTLVVARTPRDVLASWSDSAEKTFQNFCADFTVRRFDVFREHWVDFTRMANADMVSNREVTVTPDYAASSVTVVGKTAAVDDVIEKLSAVRNALRFSLL